MEYVLLKRVKEKTKLRVKMMSSAPFIKNINCQFPRDIRQEGMYYVVKAEGIKLKGTFYTAMQKDIVVCKTFDLNEVKKYVNDLTAIDKTNNTKKIIPAIIFGEDDDSECIICLNETKNTVFAPCGHYMTCSTCSVKCKTCPICRGAILAMLKRGEIAD